MQEETPKNPQIDNRVPIDNVRDSRSGFLSAVLRRLRERNLNQVDLGIENQAGSVREIGRKFGNLLVDNYSDMSIPLRDVVYAYVDYDTAYARSKLLCNEFLSGGKLAQELYRHGTKVRLALRKFADSDGKITLMRANREQDPEYEKSGWPETIKSYTSNPHVAFTFATGRLLLDNIDYLSATESVLPDSIPVEVAKVPVEDIVDVMGVGVPEEEFLVMDRSLIPDDSVRKILAAEKARFFRKPEERDYL